MVLSVLFVSLAAFSMVSSAPQAAPNPEKHAEEAAAQQVSRNKTSVDNVACLNVLKTAGASDDFGSDVGHAIHSLSLRDLQAFDPTATVENKIPTINLDLSTPIAILWHAPDIKGPDNDKFLTNGMKTLDMVLSQMDRKSWDLAEFTTLEKVVHIFHMQEFWARALVFYKKLQTTPPIDEICGCATDIDNNGVLDMLRFTALAIREPSLVYGVPKDQRIDGKANQQYAVYTYHFFLKLKPRGQTSFGPSEVLTDTDHSMPRLQHEADWVKWKKIGTVSDQESFDAALYLYCALKQDV